MSDARGSGQTPRAIADLADELRARLYGFVRGRRAPVTREEAAQAVGISRKLAAWHLEKMVEHGLLEASYGRERGRRRGRSARMYSSSPVELTVSIPQRRYDLAAEVLMDALKTTGQVGLAAAEEAARRSGERAGAGTRRERGLRPPGAERAMSVSEEVLADLGFEPYRDGRGRVGLANCPFHSLARKDPGIICRVNRSFIEGIVRGLGNTSVAAVLEPTPGECCVRLESQGGT